MLAGWIIVALLEWAASREQPHYGSGLPPRYYVPQVALPPRRPLEQVGSIYPASERRDEAPTWIAPPELREEVVGAWPVAPPHADAEPYDEPAAPELPVEVAVDEAAPERVPEPAPEPQREPEPQPEPDAPVPLGASPPVEAEPEQAAELV